MKRTEHFVEILVSGSFFPERALCPVATRDPAAVAVPSDVFAFRFYDVVVHGATRDDGERIEIREPASNESGFYYPRAKVYTLEDVEALGPEHAILASNMRCNRWRRVVQTHVGNWQPLHGADIVLADLDGKPL